MNTAAKWFRIVVWLGVLGNWTFAVFAFSQPLPLLAFLHLGDVNNTVWLFNYSVLLSILSCFYLPAAGDPNRYIANAWLLIVGRLIPASTFFVGTAMGFMPEGFRMLGIGDATFGVVELILLLKLRKWDREHAPGGRP